MNIGVSKRLFLVLFFTLTGCATSSVSDKPYVDGGGRNGDYIRSITRTKATRERVAIDYECDSACLIKLSSGAGLCVAKSASFGVHETRFTPPGVSYENGMKCKWCTERLRSFVPRCAIELFDSRHAFETENLTYFSGEEVLKACPQIPECE